MTTRQQFPGDRLESPDVTEEGRGDQSKMRHGPGSAPIAGGVQPERSRWAGFWATARARWSARRRPAPPALSGGAYLLAGILLFALTAAFLWALGRSPLCDCAAFRIWFGGAGGRENSQHLADWYSALHVVFGMLFFAVMWRTSRHWPAGWLVIAAIVAAAGWEAVENTPWMIDRYGESGAAALYRGDSIPNALADMGFMLGGFALAMALPAAAALAAGLAIEIAVGLLIRDNLVLGAIMLVHPVPAIAEWQAEGGDGPRLTGLAGPLLAAPREP